MNFIALDVETANADLSSICQIGIVRYTSGSISEEWKTYVDPEDYFSPINISIHDINESTVQGAPKIFELADKIYRYLDGNVVITHTQFDRVSVNQAFSKYNLRYPEPIWLDSAKVARRTWEQFAWSGYGLANICKEIGYGFKSHDALEDAKAAAVVFMAAKERSGIDISGWLQRVEQPINLNSAQPMRREGNLESSLYGNNLVFTGALEIPRRDAADMAAKIGCNVQSGVNKDTTMLVVGNQDITKLSGHEKSLKHRKAEELIIHGQEIRIIGENDFKELIKSEIGIVYQPNSIAHDAGKDNPKQNRKLGIVIGLDSAFTTENAHNKEANDWRGTLSKDVVKEKLTQSLQNDNKREYLTICKQHYAYAVTLHAEIFPNLESELYMDETFLNNHAGLIAQINEAKTLGNTDEEIRLLKTAIVEGSNNIYYYERLAILLSKKKDFIAANEVCKLWFEKELWTYPQTSTSNYRFLDRLEKLREKI